MDNANSSPGISAIPISQEPLQKVAPGPQETVDTLTVKARIVLLVLLFLLPPYAWYLMATNKMYHKWLVNLVLILGVLSLFSSLSYIFVVIPQFMTMYSDLNLEQPKPAYVQLGIGVFVQISMIFYALVQKRNMNQMGYIKKVHVITLIIILASIYILSTLNVLTTVPSILFPYYEQISTLQ